MSERYVLEPKQPTSERPATVQEFVEEVSQALDQAFSSVFVEGEISNLRRPGSGHLYFTLKDSQAQIRCVMWRSDAGQLRFRPADGMQVRIRGNLTVYPARGEIQISVRSMTAAGEGDLQRALAELRKRLNAEGLFDQARKRPLPAYPERIGIITSGSGAALRDILTVLARRYPLARAIVCPVVVQGEDASRQIEAAIRAFNRLAPGHDQRPDILLVARGGGSLEDLWAFNEERAVRAVHASGIPVVTGVGHETDATLVDFAADVRAATPSMAAELAVPDRAALATALNRLSHRQASMIRNRIERARSLLDRAGRVRAHGHPRLRLERAQQRLDEVSGRLDAAVRRHLDRNRLILEGRVNAWTLMNPLRPLESGFALVTEGERVIVSASGVPEDRPLSLRFRDGSVSVQRRRNE